MHEKLRIKLSKLRAIAIGWLLIAVLFAVVDHLTLNSSYTSGTDESYSFVRNLLFHIIATVIAIGFGATVLVFYIHEKYRERPYMAGILAIVALYITVVVFITFILGLLMVPVERGIPIGSAGFAEAYREYLLDTAHLKNILLWSVVVGFTQLLLQINDKFGQGLLWSLVLGKYRKAREEQRIFMFLDLKSSTTLAEKLGNKKYHELLKDFFADTTNAILYNKGEVYQYVGDEVVVTWKMAHGIENHHCLRCYFDMKRLIHGKKEKYLDRYGLVPEFKAGLHYGKVVVGEIGIIKRDITYSGDVLNTAARIQSKCNELQTPILASAQLLSLFPAEVPIDRIPVGAIALKGKASRVRLSTFQFV